MISVQRTINRVVLSGWLDAPVMLRRTPDGLAIAELTVSTPIYRGQEPDDPSKPRYRDQKSNITSFGRDAEYCVANLQQGDYLRVEGIYRTDRWKDKLTNEPRARTYVQMLDVVRLAPRGTERLQGINQVEMIGWVGEDPTSHTLESGRLVARFGMKTYLYRGRNHGLNESPYVDQWVKLTAYGRQAEQCSQTVRRGDYVRVLGMFMTERWYERDTNAPRSKSFIEVELVQRCRTHANDEEHSGAVATTDIPAQVSDQPVSVSATFIATAPTPPATVVPPTAPTITTPQVAITPNLSPPATDAITITNGEILGGPTNGATPIGTGALPANRPARLGDDGVTIWIDPWVLGQHIPKQNGNGVNGGNNTLPPVTTLETSLAHNAVPAPTSTYSLASAFGGEIDDDPDSRRF